MLNTADGVSSCLIRLSSHFRVAHRARQLVPPNAQARPPPETPVRLQQSVANYLNRLTAQRGGGSLQRPDTSIKALLVFWYHEGNRAGSARNTPRVNV